MIDREHALPLAKQAKALSISRGTLYYVSRPVPAVDLALMRRIDELHLEYPFAGSRMMQGLLKEGGFSAGRLHVATLMKRMGIAAIYRGLSVILCAGSFSIIRPRTYRRIGWRTGSWPRTTRAAVASILRPPD